MGSMPWLVAMSLVSGAASAQSQETWTCTYPSFSYGTTGREIVRLSLQGNELVDTKNGMRLQVVGDTAIMISAAHSSNQGLHYIVILRASGAMRRGNAAPRDEFTNDRVGTCTKE